MQTPTPALSPTTPVVRVPEHHADGGKPKAVLTTLTLMGVIYTASISGGYGLEDSVRAGGPFMTILFLCLIPFVWGIPVSMCVAELACAVPSNAGPIMWVNVSFKPWFTFTTVLWTMMLNFVDNSLYPTLFADYYSNVFGFGKVGIALMKVGFLWTCTLINIIGVDIVGVFSVTIMIITMLPFALMFLLQVPQGFDWERIAYVPPHINWTLFLPVVCWNFSGFDSAGHVIEEVSNPKKTFPRALLLMIFAGLCTYIPPVLVGASAHALAHVPFSKWKGGFWVNVGGAVGGWWLSYVVLIGGSISTLGLMTTLLTTTSRSLAGMGTINAFPRWISKIISIYNPKTGTPINALLLNTTVTSILAVMLTFEILVAVDQILYALRIIAILMCFIKLRYAYPELARPFVVPGGYCLSFVWALVPMAFSAFIVYMTIVGSPGLLWTTLVIVAGSIGASLVAVLWFRAHGFEGSIVDVPNDELEMSDKGELPIVDLYGTASHHGGLYPPPFETHHHSHHCSHSDTPSKDSTGSESKKGEGKSGRRIEI
jgi:amino acid transporter